MKIYLVGGAVRDALLNRPVHEKDYVVVGATVDEMLAQGFQPVGKAFPVFLHPKTKEEYALARTEKKVGKGYHGFVFHTEPTVSLEEDLIRRDLTINAMARDENGQLFDPYGGVKDLEARVLRHVSEAFAEDPVRILRIARFAARFTPLGFTVATETLLLMREMVNAGEVDALVPERVWKEMQLALCEPNPEQFFEVLKACEALKVLFPDLDRLWSMPQDPHSHPEGDAGTHTMLVLKAAVNLSKDPVVRFAALMHDLGKSRTMSDFLPKHPGHEEQGAELITALCQKYRIPNEYHELAKLTGLYHGQVHKAMKLSPTELLNLLENLDAFRRPERFELFLLACMADSRGRLGYEADPYPQAAHLRKVFQAAASIDAGAIAKGLPPAEIRDAIRAARLSKIS